MPVPLVIAAWAIGAAVAAVLAGAVALNWDKILIRLKGKRLAVLGERGVGKTHLIRFLTTGSIPEKLAQTLAPEKTPARRFKLEELDLKIKKNLDVAGGTAAYAEWKALVTRADVVFYLFRVDKLLEDDRDTTHRLRADLRHIGDWLSELRQQPMVFLIGTHCDRDPEFHKLTPKNVGKYHDNIARLPLISELIARSGGARAKLVVGSLKTKKHAESLVYQIFAQVT